MCIFFFFLGNSYGAYQKNITQYCKYRKIKQPLYAKSNFEVIFNVKYKEETMFLHSVERGFVIGYMAYTDPCECNIV